MAVVTTNLGVVTAYGDAVEGGYTGTKEQWQSLMADYGTIGAQAQADAQTASTAAQTATTKASEASASATQAQQAAASVSTPDTTLTQSGKAADAKATGDEISALKENLNAVFVTDSASGALAHFEDGADDVAMKSVVIDTASASATVTRTGKNLLPHDKGSYTSSSLTFTLQSDGGIKIVGTSTDIRNYQCYDDITAMNLKAGVEYRAILTGSGTGYVQGGGNAQSVKLQLYVDDASAFIEQDKTFTIPDTATSSYLRLRCPPLTYDCIVYPLLILASETDTAYEPYNGNTYDVTLVDGVVQEEINSLLGINNVWSDSGDVDVEYRADTKLYIDKRLGV